MSQLNTSIFKVCQSQIFASMQTDFYFLVPAPMLISVTSNPTSPIRPIGSAVNLTCIVVLSPFVDVPVTVAIHLSDPAGSPLTTTTPSVSGSNYTSTSMVNSFGREDSGLYTCRASTSSNFPFLRDSGPNSVELKVTVGETITIKFLFPCILDNLQSASLRVFST